MVNSPGVFDGSVGFQFLPFIHKYEVLVAVHESDEHFRHDCRPDRSERAVAALLRLLRDVVPERRVLMQAVLLGDRTVRSLRDLVGRQRVLDLHRLGDVLARRQAEHDAALEVAERKAAAAARQMLQLPGRGTDRSSAKR